jgi:putative RecB family exonuclease
MTVYSHSQLSTYEECPLKYKLCYLDKIKRDTESVEAFVGSMVHDTLKKCYDDIKLTKLNSLDNLISYYDRVWQQNWHDSIVITKADLTRDHYQNMGRKLLETYYARYCPFDADITISTERKISFSLDENNNYRLTGFIDRLSRARDGVYQIHDYKTSAYLPGQAEIDRDRQLGLYQIGIQRTWPDIKQIRLIWHYIAFDRELVSNRSQEDMSKLTAETIRLIGEIESANDFPPNESGLCGWCEYPDLCPMRKHYHTVESLPANEYLAEPGVTLVNRYAELKEKAAEVDLEVKKVREAIIDYARRENVQVIKGSACKARIKFDKALKFPAKTDPERKYLDESIIKAGKWMEVSQLDTVALSHIVEEQLWDKELVDEVIKYGRIEETSTVYLSRLKNEE